MKIAVMGPPGAGKTNFSRKLGLALNIKEVYHLDYYFWKPGWIRTTQHERLEILMQLMESKSWIIEGNYRNTVDYQLSNADTVILLKIPIVICFYRILAQQITYLFNEPPEIAPGCTDQFSYNYLKSILTYYLIDYSALMERLPFYSQIRFIVLKNAKEINGFLENPSLTMSNIGIS